MKKIAIICLCLGFAILIFYIFHLCYAGYINPQGSFSIDVAKDISPFVGSFIAVFFSLASILLILENLNMQNTFNERNQILTQKNQFESIFFNLMGLHNKIVNEINTDLKTSYDKTKHKSLRGRVFFDLLAPSMAFDYQSSDVKSIETLQKIFKHYYAIHASDMGHYFRNLFHIVNFVDKNPYFNSIAENNDFLQQKDYIKILRAQLTNTEMACLAINGLDDKGNDFKPLILKYELLKNINFDFGLSPDDYWDVIPAPEILIEHYPFLKPIYEYQKNNS